MQIFGHGSFLSFLYHHLVFLIHLSESESPSGDYARRDSHYPSRRAVCCRSVPRGQPVRPYDVWTDLTALLVTPYFLTRTVVRWRTHRSSSTWAEVFLVHAKLALQKVSTYGLTFTWEARTYISSRCCSWRHFHGDNICGSSDEKSRIIGTMCSDTFSTLFAMPGVAEKGSVNEIVEAQMHSRYICDFDISMSAPPLCPSFLLNCWWWLSRMQPYAKTMHARAAGGASLVDTDGHRGTRACAADGRFLPQHKCLVETYDHLAHRTRAELVP
ncbi:hypothetical protein FB451DRAFT_1414006 [Mycena latifolia]|nr:hypothetical protein FB451DRAFT_1414006 [Mycena latifolia]